MKYYVALDLPDHEVDPIAPDDRASIAAWLEVRLQQRCEAVVYGSVADMVAEEGGVETVAVLCTRHPDASNEYTISNPEGVPLVVIDVDYGSGFDGQPGDEDEAEYAIEMALNITKDASVLPDGDPVKVAVAGIADDLRDDARRYLTKARIRELEEDFDAPAEEMGEDDFHDLTLCPDCDADLSMGGKHETDCPLAARFAHLEEDPDAPDDGKVLVAGILYNAETGEEAVPQ